MSDLHSNRLSLKTFCLKSFLVFFFFNLILAVYALSTKILRVCIVQSSHDVQEKTLT